MAMTLEVKEAAGETAAVGLLLLCHGIIMRIITISPAVGCVVLVAIERLRLHAEQQ
jgi:hypothetical protein